MTEPSIPLDSALRNSPSISEENGIIRVITQKFLSRESYEAHFAAMDNIMKATRRRQEHIRVLVDLRRAPVLAADTAAYVGSALKRLYQPQDQVAAVVDSRLLQMQLRRLIMHPNYRVFDTMTAAISWLSD